MSRHHTFLLSAAHPLSVRGLLHGVAIVCFSFFALAAQAASWAPELIKTKGELRGPDEPIQLKISAPAETIQRLALELDGFDVSQIVRFDGSIITLTPPQPLAYGEHKLRLIEYLTDGAPVERGAWTLSIRKSAAFSEAELQGRVWLDASVRVADSNLVAPEPDRLNLGGGAQLQGKIAEDTWRASAVADLLYNNNESLLPRGADSSKADLGHFLLTAQTGPMVAQAGHFNAAPVDNLVMQGFTRRGVSVGANWPDIGSSVTAFSQSTQDVVGFRSGLGVSDAQNRSDGIVLTSRPLREQRDSLLISALYVDGTGPEQTGTPGTGVVGDATRTQGRATGLVAEGNLLHHRLRLRGEFATSDFDFDGDGRDLDNDGVIDVNLSPERDHAYSALVAYTPWHDKLLGDRPLAWNVGLENKRIGSYYRSPANPGGLADQQAVRAYSDMGWSGLYGYVSLGRMTDNVNDDPLRARIRSNDAVLSTTYTPTLIALPAPQGQAPALPWYGQPSYTLALSKIDQVVESPGGGLALGDLNATTSASFFAGFSYVTWNWLVSHIISENDNKTGQSVDSRSVATQLAASMRLNERLNISTYLQYSSIQETNAPVNVTAKDTDTWTAGLSMGYLISKNLNSLLQYNYNDAQTSDHSLDNTSRDLIASLGWSVRQAKGATPGVTLWLEGQSHDVAGQVAVATSSATAPNQDSYQIFLKLSMDWAPHY